MPLQVKQNADLLYPDIEPFNQFYLDVGDGHSLYVEESGNKDGLPVIFLHGGPGGRSHPSDRRYFDPNLCRIILFDQRGSGKSTPFASVQANTSQHLINDIETIRKKLNVNKMILFGGSWGSTLALLYAIEHTSHVLGLVLRGLFTGSKEELDWFYEGHGANWIYPDAWEEFISPLASPIQGKIIESFWTILQDKNHPQYPAAVNAWSAWEGRALSLTPKEETLSAFLEDKHKEALARIECHYFRNNIFLTKDHFRDGLQRLSQTPISLTHGRYDMICPIRTAWKFASTLPHVSLTIVEDAGHTISERGITQSVVYETKRLVEEAISG